MDTNEQAAGEVYVWDKFIRLFHLSLVIAFFTAYFVEGEDETLLIHVWAGYAVGGLLTLRIIWGFIGPKHARFRDFIFGPFTTLQYLKDLFGGSAKRYLGHSPAGASMVFLLIITLTVTVVSGLAVYALEENEGPLAPLFVNCGLCKSNYSLIKSALADERDDENGSKGKRREDLEDFYEEMHEVMANVALILVLLHIGGVVLASRVHKENLVKAMITGKKRAN